MASRGAVAVFAILGQFEKWSRVGYIVEDVDDTGNRKVYGVDKSCASCVYGGGDCGPIGSSVAEYALALHKAVRGHDVHLTFFVPLSLIDFRKLMEFKGRIDANTLAGVIRDDVIRRFKAVVEKSDEPLRSAVARSLEEIELVDPDSGNVPVLALRTEPARLTRGRITTLFVPIPARVTLKNRDTNTVFSFLADLDDIRSIMFAWIMYVLRDSVRPALAVVDTTHGINYLAGLLEEEFTKAASIMPRGVTLRAQFYNTDPVLPPPEGTEYKYHLLEERTFSSTRLTHSLPELAARLRDYAGRVKENVSAGGGVNPPEGGSGLSGVKPVVNVNTVVDILDGYAVPFFENEVLLWGTVFAEAALRLVERSGVDRFSRFSMAVFVEKGSVVRVKQTLIPHAIGDIRNYDDARRLALVSSSLRGLRELLGNTLSTLKDALTESGIELLLDPLVLYEETEGARDDAVAEKKVFRYRPPSGEEEGELPPEYPPAAYVLLRHALREDVAGFSYGRFKGKEGEGVRPRNFIAHAGLSRGVVVDVREEDGVYTVKVDLARLRVAALSLRRRRE